MEKELLYHLHYFNNLSITKIAKELNCSHMTIYRAFKRFGIQCRKSELLIGKHQGGRPIGAIPWNKGITGLSIGWPKGKSRPRGKDSPSWRGGEERYSRINDVYLKTWRKAVYTRDNYTCQYCGARGVKLNAHHIKFWRDYPELRYTVSNGETVCIPCHKKIHSNVLTRVP